MFFINQVDDPEAKNHRWRQYREVWGFVEGEGCRPRSDPAALRRSESRPTPPGAAATSATGRWRSLESATAKRPASGAAETRDLDEAIVAVVERAEPSIGRTKTVEILRGGRSKALLKYSYDSLPGYGDFADWHADDVLARVDALIESGRLRKTGGRYPTLRVAQAA